jgi:hypothetical protein
VEVDTWWPSARIIAAILRCPQAGQSGRVRWVQLDLDVDDHDHLITPEERLRIAMARQ